jgi:hypothetical protein
MPHDRRVDLDALVYVDEAALYACVAESTIRQWARRYPHVLPVRSRDWRGRTRYRLGDVLEVERATRTGRSLTAAS